MNTRVRFHSENEIVRKREKWPRAGEKREVVRTACAPLAALCGARSSCDPSSEGARRDGLRVVNPTHYDARMRL